MAILISVLLIGVMLSIVFSLSAIFIPKIRASAETKNSVPAVYAAESAIEWCLYLHYVSPSPQPPPPTMVNGATYTKQNGNPLTAADCNLPTIQVNGAYRGVTRSFQITP